MVLHVALTTEISNNIGSLVKHHRRINKSASLEVEGSASTFSALESNKPEDSSLCTTGANVIKLSVFMMLGLFKCYAECRYAECGGATIAYGLHDS